MSKLIIVLIVLIIGYGAVVLHYLHDCRKAKYIEKDIGRDENNGTAQI